MMAGIAQTQTRRICFCDADLRGFRTWHADALCLPSDGEIIGRCDTQTLWSLSGQRSLPRVLVDGLPLNGYAAEQQINEAVRAACLPVYHVELFGVITDMASRVTPRVFDVFRDYRRRMRL